VPLPRGRVATLRGSLFAQPCGLLLRSTTPHRSHSPSPTLLFYLLHPKYAFMQPPPPLSSLAQSVVHVLLYRELFQYPLTSSEIHSRINQPATPQQLDDTLNDLVQHGMIYLLDNKYYATANQPDWVPRRQKGNQLTQQYLEIAERKTRLIASFPFVRGVMLSGSLSKQYIDHDGDIDYFILTEPNRLWIARTLLIVFKKIFLFNSHKYFCINYLIDTDHLIIEDQNIFTATEVVSLIPTYNYTLYTSFLQANNWTKAYYPYFPLQASEHTRTEAYPRIKKCLEWCLNNVVGNRLDDYFMRISIRRWQSKFGYMQAAELEHALRSRKYISKHHPQQFQRLVLDGLQQKQQAWCDRFGVRL
jgi:hypothetical protein